MARLGGRFAVGVLLLFHGNVFSLFLFDLVLFFACLTFCVIPIGTAGNSALVSQLPV